MKLPSHPPRPTYRMARRALLHVALIFFALDVLACLFPWFDRFWHDRAHVLVALAAFCETVSEYLFDAEQAKIRAAIREGAPQ